MNPILKGKVHLNHIYLIVGTELADAFKDFFFLDKFANTEIKTVSTTDRGMWHGIYLRGLNTYLELFDSFENIPIGSIGFAFGVDKEEYFPLVHDALKKLYPDISIRMFQISENPYPQFNYIELPRLGNSLSRMVNPFIICYTPDTFKNPKYCDFPSQYVKENISRARYEEPFVDRSKMFKDITSIAFELENNDIKKQFFLILKMLGFEQTQRNGENIFISSGFRIIIKDCQKESMMGITLETELFQDYKKQEILLGNGKLNIKADKNKATITISNF